MVPNNAELRSSGIKIHGVTGNHLTILGSLEVGIEIGDLSDVVDVLVVDEMADNVFILGRDLLDRFQCVVDYKAFTLSIGECSIPIMKPHNSSYIRPGIDICCLKTVSIPPFSKGTLRGYLKTSQSGVNRSFLSVTGVLVATARSDLQVKSGIINSNRGKIPVEIVNVSDKPLLLYRNSKLANFLPLHAVEINSLNYSPALEDSSSVHMLEDSSLEDNSLVRNGSVGEDSSSDHMHGGSSLLKTTTVPEAEWNLRPDPDSADHKLDKKPTYTPKNDMMEAEDTSKSRERWVDNIDSLFKLLRC